MEKKSRNAWIGAAALGTVGLVAGAIAYSGVYNVAATDPHLGITEWALRSVMKQSVRRHARGITVPEGYDLTSPALAARAIGHYSVACATCHGAPGEGRSPWMVAYPEAPLLTRAEVVGEWTDGELFWMIKNGIKDTGMLALGPTHRDEDIWAVTAFVRQLPGMTETEYRRLVSDHRQKGH